MTIASTETPAGPRILLFGFDKKGIAWPGQLVHAGYAVDFAPYEAPSRFQDYDLVVLFQGCFSSYREVTRNYGSDSRLVCDVDDDQLHRRQNELRLLLQKGGAVCFILCEPFRDSASRKPSDLAQVAMGTGIRRKDFKTRKPTLQIVRDEFRDFLSQFGAAHSEFLVDRQVTGIRPIARKQDALVGFVRDENRLFVPALLPDTHQIQDYFLLLVAGIIDALARIRADVPGWANEFAFAVEQGHKERAAVLESQLQTYQEALERLRLYKRALASSSDALVDDVANVLKALGLKLDETDDGREDLKILGDDGAVTILVEVKGTSKGVKREHVNQADNHRERSGLPADFPTLLIINTHAKASSTLAEKDQPVAPEQVAHARSMNVLVTRTLDLLRLLDLHLQGDLSTIEVRDHLRSPGGWLHVSDRTVSLEGEAV